MAIAQININDTIGQLYDKTNEIIDNVNTGVSNTYIQRVLFNYALKSDYGSNTYIKASYATNSYIHTNFFKVVGGISQSNLDMGTYRIVQSSAPTIGTHLTNRSYVDTALSNLNTTISASLTGKQATNANLTALSGISGTADTIPYFTSTSGMATASFGSVARTFLAQTTVANQRTTLGLGALATLNQINSTSLFADGQITFSKLASSIFPNDSQMAYGTTNQSTVVTPYRVNQNVLNWWNSIIWPNISSKISGGSVDLIAFNDGNVNAPYIRHTNGSIAWPVIGIREGSTVGLFDVGVNPGNGYFMKQWGTPSGPPVGYWAPIQMLRAGNWVTIG